MIPEHGTMKRQSQASWLGRFRRCDGSKPMPKWYLRDSRHSSLFVLWSFRVSMAPDISEIKTMKVMGVPPINVDAMELDQEGGAVAPS